MRSGLGERQDRCPWQVQSRNLWRQSIWNFADPAYSTECRALSAQGALRVEASELIANILARAADKLRIRHHRLLAQGNGVDTDPQLTFEDTMWHTECPLYRPWLDELIVPNPSYRGRKP